MLVVGPATDKTWSMVLPRGQFSRPGFFVPPGSSMGKLEEIIVFFENSWIVLPFIQQIQQIQQLSP